MRQKRPTDGSIRQQNHNVQRDVAEQKQKQKRKKNNAQLVAQLTKTVLFKVNRSAVR